MKYVKNRVEKRLVLERVVGVEAPTMRKVIEEGATIYFIIMKLIFCQYI